MNKTAVIQIRDDIIRAALPHVVFDGWVWEMVLRAAEEAGHKENVARAVFPEKMIDVLDGFADLADREMARALENINPEDLRIRDRVRKALMARYEWLGPHKEALRESLAFWAVPTRKPRAMKIVWRTADHIWGWAGDEARDYNRYTKRGLLSGIIVSTTLVWLNDADEEMRATREFMDRRIENIMQIGKFLGKLKKA